MWGRTCSVVDPHHFDADPDPTYHFDAEPDMDPDSWFLFDADPEFYLTHFFTRMQIRILILIWSWFLFDADADPGSQNDEDPDLQHCVLVHKTFKMWLSYCM